jgi:hypothetical protein
MGGTLSGTPGGTLPGTPGTVGGTFANSGGASSSATGGLTGTGGANTSVPDTLVGSGGTGGAAPTTTNPRAFRAGPCVVTTAPDIIEVLARGASQIYRRPVGGTEPSNWAAIPDLDASIIDNRSDLDCMNGYHAIHVVASGRTPLGSILHATGTGTVYNPFVRVLTDRTMDPSPSIWTNSSDSFIIGATNSPVLFAGEVTSGVVANWNAPYGGVNDNIKSGPDIAIRASAGNSSTIFAAFDDINFLNAHYYLQSSAPAYWYEKVLAIAPPSSTTFTFSPSVCVGNYHGLNTTYFVATTQDHKLWIRTATGLEFESLSAAWQQLSDDAYSAPDCVVSNYGEDVNVVVRTQRDTVMLHKGTGKGTSWISSELGVYLD